MGKYKMKFLTFGLLSVLLLAYAYAEESNELSDKTDAEVLNTDYHVCTAGHLRVIIRRLTVLRNRCWHTTKVRRAHCRRRIHWLLTHQEIQTLFEILQQTYPHLQEEILLVQTSLLLELQQNHQLLFSLRSQEGR